MSSIAVSTTINDDDVEFLCQPNETLLDVLRNRLGLMGAKEGCGTGDCGACSTIMDGRVVCSMNLRWSGCSSLPLAMPSIVSMVRPCASAPLSLIHI